MRAAGSTRRGRDCRTPPATPDRNRATGARSHRVQAGAGAGPDERVLADGKPCEQHGGVRDISAGHGTVSRLSQYTADIREHIGRIIDTRISPPSRVGTPADWDRPVKRRDRVLLAGVSVEDAGQLRNAQHFCDTCRHATELEIAERAVGPVQTEPAGQRRRCRERSPPRRPARHVVRAAAGRRRHAATRLPQDRRQSFRRT